MALAYSPGVFSSQREQAICADPSQVTIPFRPFSPVTWFGDYAELQPPVCTGRERHANRRVGPSP
jgi:hypothetical protein